MTFPEAQVRGVCDSISAHVQSGLSLDGAVDKLRRAFQPAEALLDEARAMFLERLVRSRGGIQKGKRELWYTGPKESDKYWPRVLAELESNPNLSAEAIVDIDESSTHTLAALSAPGTSEFHDRGMVLGYVQSGKTTNFSALIAKAVDAGYRLIIVLSGMTDGLRFQTQERIDEVVIGDDFRADWQVLTTVDEDFSQRGHNAANMILNNDTPLIAVVKKNKHRLQRLNSWLKAAGTVATNGLPILVIDDEADQASINTADGDAVSAINNQLRELVAFPRTAYVAYTATPFANLLINPNAAEDLYPSDFIHSMTRPDGYFGAEALFGGPTSNDGGDSDYDVIRVVEEMEADDLKPGSRRSEVADWTPNVGPALRRSIEWFLISTAARRARSHEDSHASMLIHTSMLSDAHFALAGPVKALVHDLRVAVELDSTAVLSSLEELYESETRALPPEDVGHSRVPWHNVLRELPRVIAEADVVIDNYRSHDRLSYGEAPRTVIVIGGNTLSRGLTLEGLSSSFFVRGASAYDTLLQMGRWFGFRAGYEDLCRVWMPRDLRDLFESLSEVELSIREEIARYELEGITPAMAGVRIRQHPDIAITAASKMRDATVASLSYSGLAPQTTVFARDESEILAANMCATQELLTRLQDPIIAKLSDGVHTIFDGVPVEMVKAFLGDFHFHPFQVSLTWELLSAYLAKETAESALLSWRVVIMSKSGADRHIELPGGVAAGTYTRSRIPTEDNSIANIRALPSQGDRTIGSVEGMPLLRVYVIDKDSPAPGGKSARLPLDAAEDIIGLTIEFPRSARADGEADYVVAAIDSSAWAWDEEWDLATAEELESATVADSEEED